MKSKFNSRPQSEQQYVYGMRDSIAGLAVSMAAVCGVAPHQPTEAAPTEPETDNATAEPVAEPAEA